MKLSLQIAFVLCLVGVGFSGALTYAEVFGNTAVSCPSLGAPGTFLGYPGCVYGFLLFVILAVVTGVGLRSASAGNTRILG